MSNISELLKEKTIIEKQLSQLVHGSIEKRTVGNKDYLYVHYRNEGLSVTKFVGEYTDSLCNMILSNNVIAKEYKKKIRSIDKELKNLNFISNANPDDRVLINLDLARRYMVESIYKQSMLEGVATTYSDTETIVNGGIVNNMTSDDVSKVINLKRSWEFIMSKDLMMYPTNYALICQINQIVEEGFSYTAGRIRSVPVHIGGCSYIPPLPIEDKVKEELNELVNSNKENIDIAIDLVLYIMKKQLFLDGNKRTAIIAANHFMISHGLGIIVVPVELVKEYKSFLVKYYENEDCKNEIASFLKEKCWISF